MIPFDTGAHIGSIASLVTMHFNSRIDHGRFDSEGIKGIISYSSRCSRRLQLSPYHSVHLTLAHLRGKLTPAKLE